MTDALTHLTHISSTTVNMTVSLLISDENQISAAHRKNASDASVRQSFWQVTIQPSHAPEAYPGVVRFFQCIADQWALHRTKQNQPRRAYRGL